MVPSGLAAKSQTLTSFVRMGRVMGNLGRDRLPVTALKRFIPLRTYSCKPGKRLACEWVPESQGYLGVAKT